MDEKQKLELTKIMTQIQNLYFELKPTQESVENAKNKLAELDTSLQKILGIV